MSNLKILRLSNVKEMWRGEKESSPSVLSGVHRRVTSTSRESLAHIQNKH